jgi:hypothetical protein
MEKRMDFAFAIVEEVKAVFILLDKTFGIIAVK